MRPRDAPATVIADSETEVLQQSLRQARGLIRVTADLERHSYEQLSEFDRTFSARRVKLETAHAKASTLGARTIENIQRSKDLLSRSAKYRI